MKTIRNYNSNNAIFGFFGFLISY